MTLLQIMNHILNEGWLVLAAAEVLALGVVLVTVLRWVWEDLK